MPNKYIDALLADESARLDLLNKHLAKSLSPWQGRETRIAIAEIVEARRQREQASLIPDFDNPRRDEP